MLIGASSEIVTSDMYSFPTIIKDKYPKSILCVRGASSIIKKAKPL